MSSTIDYKTLQWVKQELNESLKEARVALSEFVEQPDDETQLAFCVAHLHQVRGTLQMVELYGAALFAEEMEKLAQALQSGKVAQKEDAYELLMGAMLQLPDYFERLMRGFRDVPLILLPVLNDLRAIRGEALLSENALFAPDLSRPLPEAVRAEASDVDSRALARRLRHPYQLALLSWFRDRDTKAALDKLHEVLIALMNASQAEPVRRLWWVAAGLLESLRDDRLIPSVTTKLLMGQIDRQIKRLISEGEQAMAANSALDLLKNLLFYVGRSQPGGTLAQQIKDAYALDSLLLSEEEVEHVRESLSGHNEELMATVSNAIKEDLTGVKDRLDLYLRSGSSDVLTLTDSAAALQRISDTLGMIGLGALRNKVGEQVAILGAMVNGERATTEADLMAMAGVLLYVESSLSVPPESVQTHLVGEAGPSHDESQIPEAEFDLVRGAVAGEALRDLAMSKDAILEFTREWDSGTLLPVPQFLYQIKGALLLLSELRAAALVEAIRRYVQAELIDAGVKPDAQALDNLAEAISSIEYSLEDLRESKVFSESVLDVAEQSARLLGYPPQPVELIEGETDSAASERMLQSAQEEPEPELPELGVEDIEIPVLVDEAARTASGEEVAAGAEPSLDQEPEPTELLETGEPPELEEQTKAVDEEEIAAPEIEPEIEVDAEPPVEAIAEADVADEAVEEVELAVDDATDETAAQVPAPAVAAVAALASLPVLAEDFDAEILEIFVEEAQEELESLRSTLPAWIANEDDTDALADARRSFHTLKGSGRLVGALRVGEFAWSFEKMLNRVIDATVQRSDAMCALLPASIVAVEQLVAQLQTQVEPDVDAAGLMMLADRLSQGETLGVEEIPDLGGQLEPATEAQAEPEAIEDELAAADSGAEVAATVEAESEVEAAYDPVLYGIFSNESQDHLSAIQAFIDDCSDHDGPCRPTKDLARALHTLLGSARMAEAHAIGEIAHAYESFAKNVAALQSYFSDEAMELLGQLWVAVNDILARMPEELPDPTEFADLVERINALPIEAAPDIAQSIERTVAANLVPAESGASDAPTQAAAPAADAEEPDAELAAIFLEEAEEILERNEATVARWAAKPGDMDLVGQMQRDLHTLKGGARMADLTPIGDLSHELETLLTMMAEGRLAPSTSLVDVISISQDELMRMVEAVRDHQALHSVPDLIDDLRLLGNVPATTFVTQEKAAQSDELPAAASEEAEAELVEVFMEEAVELLRSSEATLLKWKAAPDQPDQMAELQRELHTLKGGARMANIGSVGDLSHAVESLLTSVSDGYVPADHRLFDLLQVAHDRLSQMVEAIAEKRQAQSEPGLIEELESLRAAGVVSTVAVTPQPSSLEDSIAEIEAAEVESLAEADVADEAADRRVAARVQQELVRVRADLLDNLVNYAGEISIYRARMEQQVGSFRFNLSELEQTVDRLRDRLRKLEIETEAQILFRYETEATEPDQEFDPLEMDRYSTMQQLSRSMQESIGDLLSIQSLLDNTTRESETLLGQQARVNTELQEGLMRTRMVPFSGLAPRMRRIVRQSAQELGKRVELQLEGAEGEMDRTVIDRIVAPLEHMLRNAVSHGIEMPLAREAAGKPETGTIRLSLSRDGAEVVIRIRDDGAGISLGAIRNKARERGLLDEHAQLSDHELMQFVLETGFSTAEEITQISGRGVGMDVVNSEVKQLGGSLQIDSQAGQYTEFTVRLPFTLAISQALLVQVHEEIYAIPLTGIEGVVRMPLSDLRSYYQSENARFEYAGVEYSVDSLSAKLGLGDPNFSVSAKRMPVLLVRSGDQRLAIQVDALLGSRETVVKSVGPQISTVRGISGATILGDGRVVLILDLPALLRAGTVVQSRAQVPEQIAPAQVTTVMVVDDSITVRKVTKRLLERNHYAVMTAKDGVDAVSQLEERVPDLMLLDIEMPRMDGFELASYIRNDSRLRDLPIIMITSRTGEKHRQRALDIGVNAYLGKPYQETDLLDQITAVLEAD